MGFRALVLLCVCAPLLSGCTTAMVAMMAASEAEAASLRGDRAFAEHCARYGGERREFIPDRTSGVRVYAAASDLATHAPCGEACQEYLAEGYAFVDVVVQVRKQSQAERSVIDRYAMDWTAGDPVHVERRADSTALVEAVWFLTSERVSGDETSARDVSRRGERIIARSWEGRGQVFGSFRGERRLSDGALHGEGAFRLTTSFNEFGGPMTVERCP